MDDYLLRRIGAVVSLSDVEKAAFAPFFVEQRAAPAGERLVQAGGRYDYAFLLREGWAFRYQSLKDGRRQILNFLLPGDIFGLASIVVQTADHSVEALTPVQVSRITAADLVAFVGRSPLVGMALIWGAAQENAVLREHIVDIGRRNAYERLAHMLLELHARLGLVGLVEDGAFALPLSQTHLADALGLSIVHVNRTIRRLHREGMVRVCARRIELLEIAQLRRIADFKSGFLHLDSKVPALVHPPATSAAQAP